MEAQRWTHAVKCWQAFNDKWMVIPGTCWLLLPVPSGCWWKFSRAAVFLRRDILFKVFCRRLSFSRQRLGSHGRWGKLAPHFPSATTSARPPARPRQTVGKEAVSCFHRAGKFGTAIAEATIAVTFSGCESQHQLWPRPFPFRRASPQKVDDVLLSPDVLTALLKWWEAGQLRFHLFV